MHTPSQWEMMLQCNIVSQWLSAYTKWSLFTYTHSSSEAPQQCCGWNRTVFWEHKFQYGHQGYTQIMRKPDAYSKPHEVCEWTGSWNIHEMPLLPVRARKLRHSKPGIIVMPKIIVTGGTGVVIKKNFHVANDDKIIVMSTLMFERTSHITTVKMSKDNKICSAAMNYQLPQVTTTILFSGQIVWHCFFQSTDIQYNFDVYNIRWKVISGIGIYLLPPIIMLAYC